MAKKEKKEGSESRHRLVLLDTHAIIHRAYHAIPDLTTSKGEPSGALYGLVSMLLRTVNDLKPDYIVATRDLPGPTHRHKKFEAYKGTRAKTEDALIAQLERAPIVFEAFGIPIYAAPGYEADDCIGTIVEGLKAHDHIDTIIASGDMDTLQLVSPTVGVYTMRKGITDIKFYDKDEVRERYGFGPEHVVDYKALRGDPSDNIPGIKGIGEKTATDLIKAFGSLEDIYKAIDKDPELLIKKGIKPRIVQLLIDGKESAYFSKDLSTIHTDAPISFTLPEKKWELADHLEGIERLCDELEFRSLKDRVRKLLNADYAAEAGEEASEALPEVDKTALAEVSVALWVLNSDIANPSLTDIFEFTGVNDFDTAREKIFALLKETPILEKVYNEIEKPLIPIVDRMHVDGVAIDVKYLKSLAKEYTTGLKEIEKRIYAHAGHEFNINSPKQLGIVLYDELKIGEGGKQKKTAGGARTTREDELVKLADQHPIIADILAHRELQKLLSTYIDKIPDLVEKDGRLHAEFLQAGSATGRMASQNPNVQNIPIKTEYGRRIRSAFVAAPGCILATIDYSQIELRIAAGLSGDEKLLRVFKEGGDIHTEVASFVFGVEKDKVDREMRRRAKVINFGILYGMGVNALRANLGASVTRAEAAEYLEDYFKTFSGVTAWIEKTKAFVHKHGYVETLYGRRRYFPGIKSTLPGVVAAAERAAVNAPMQGTQADIIKLAMIEADTMIEREGLRDRVKLLLQVHDELMYEVAEKDADEIVPRLRQVMESIVEGDALGGVPIIAEASMGKNWGEMRKIGR
jgi:DNA polymerase-1